MARERIKTLRPDATGFGKAVTAGSQRPELGTISDDAINSFKAQPAVAPPALESTNRDGDMGHAHAEPDVTQKEVEQASSSGDRETGPSPKAKANPSPHRLAHLVVPRRAGSKPGAPHTLRLRVLQRHADALERLEAEGTPRATVLKAAYANMPTITIEPRYVPQSMEVSGPAEWSHRITMKVEPQVIRAIAATVRNGNKAPKSALLLGQIEPAWFSSLDAMIKDYTE
ncbi:hypothetical protein E4191_17940 (plasmid) [Paracoccus liaowanqingii]|uniref:Uncharacterized protein n=1 Tax=Paracoccus liaowanqingii TaxID=2560053 RepID=A0A4Y5SRA7_9RHOB|nr:hypothetical protein [Paracoccus liaowanqingii]QDA36020.1 hypothetical protein E4191_17940 [Paracoccus liaowanqingii]